MAKKNKRHQAPRKGAGIPAEARYVNVTTLDDDLLQRICKLSESRAAGIAYLVFGILAIALAAVTFVFMHAELTTTLVLAGFGVLFLYQRTQLTKRTAKNLGKELDKTGEGARTRTMFFTASEVGTVDEDGSIHTFSYSAIDHVYEDERMFALVLHDDSGIVAVAKAGFSRGNAEDFGEAIRHHVEAANARMRSEVRPRKKGAK